MDWRRELSQLERAYDALLPTASAGAFNASAGSLNRSSNGIKGKPAVPSNLIIGDSIQFNFKKWSDQGIQQFPPVVVLSLPELMNVPYFEKPPDLSKISQNTDFNNELQFLKSYCLSIYNRAVENRNRCLAIGRVLVSGPTYLDEEDEQDLDRLTAQASSYDQDRAQLSDEVNAILNRKLVDFEHSNLNVGGTIVSKELNSLREACFSLRGELFETDKFLKVLFSRLGELKLTPINEFCPMDGIKPNWVDIDKVRVKQPLSHMSRNFVTFMSCKELPINKDVFRFLQSPSAYAHTLQITNSSFAVGELQAILDFFVLASHPMVYGRNNRNTLAKSVARSLYSDRDNDSEFSANTITSAETSNKLNSKLINSVQTIVITNCSLQDRDCNALAMRLALFSNVSILCLNDNQISSSGATGIATALWSSPMSIRVLSLANNRIGVDGAIALAKVLPRCRQLHSLNLSGNPLGDIGAFFVLKSLLNKYRKASLTVPRPSSLVGSEYDCASDIDDDDDDEADGGGDDMDALLAEGGMQGMIETLSVTTPSASTRTTASSSSTLSGLNEIKDKQKQKEKDRLKKRALMAKEGTHSAMFDQDEDDAFSISDTSVYSEGSHIPRKPPNFRAILMQQTAIAMYGNQKRSIWREKFLIIRVKLFAVLCFLKLNIRGLPIKQLQLANCNLTTESVVLLQYVKQDNIYVSDVDLSYNREIADDAASSLSAIIESNSIESLKLCACSLTDIGIQALMHSACRSARLQSLDVSRNHGGPTAISWVASSASQFTVDELTLSAGYRNIITGSTIASTTAAMMNASGDASNDRNRANGNGNWDLWQSADQVALEIAEFYGGGFNDEDNDFEGDEFDDDQDDDGEDWGELETEEMALRL